MTAGRPTKYTPEMREALLSWIRGGSTYTDACRLEGISYETFLQWQQKYPEFSEDIEKADALCKQTRVATILVASKKSWQAAAWYLERRYKDEFALKTLHDINHSITAGVENALSVVSAIIGATKGSGTKTKRRSR